MQVCWQLASRIRTELVPSWSCSQAIRKPVCHIPLLRVRWKAPDDGQRNSPKHVEFYSKNKFEKLVHLVGFIIRIYHDAWSPERKICKIHVEWLRCCATNRKVAGSIPTDIIGFFIDIKSFWSHYVRGVDSFSNRNEYQDYFLGIKAAGA